MKKAFLFLVIFTISCITPDLQQQNYKIVETQKYEFVDGAAGDLILKLVDQVPVEIELTTTTNKGHLCVIDKSKVLENNTVHYDNCRFKFKMNDRGLTIEIIEQTACLSICGIGAYFDGFYKKRVD